jgi:hypothetical protein
MLIDALGPSPRSLTNLAWEFTPESIVRIASGADVGGRLDALQYSVFSAQFGFAEICKS